MKRKVILIFLWLLSYHSGYAKLTMGVVFYDPPLVFSASQGFNIDLAKQLCKGLNEDCDIRNMIWHRLFTALDQGGVDVIVGAYITPERTQKYLMSQSYMPSLGRFMTLTASNLNSVDQLKNQTVGIIQEEAGSGVFHNYVNITYPNLFKLVDYRDLTSLLNGLSKKDIKAAIVHNNAVNYWIMNGNGLLTTIGEPFELGEGYGLLTQLPNTELMDRLNTQLTLLKKNGIYQTIYDNYF